MTNEFEAKATIIEILEKSELNQSQINNTIKELIEYYNLENFIADYLKEEESVRR